MTQLPLFVMSVVRVYPFDDSMYFLAVFVLGNTVNHHELFLIPDRDRFLYAKGGAVNG